MWYLCNKWQQPREQEQFCKELQNVLHKACGAWVFKIIKNKVWTKLLQREAICIKIHQSLISWTPQLNNVCKRANSIVLSSPCYPLHAIYLHVPVFETQFLNYFLHFVHLLSTGWHLFCKINLPFVICVWEEDHVEAYTEEREQENSYTEPWPQNDPSWERPRYLLSA